VRTGEPVARPYISRQGSAGFFTTEAGEYTHSTQSVIFDRHYVFAIYRAQSRLSATVASV